MVKRTEKAKQDKRDKLERCYAQIFGVMADALYNEGITLSEMDRVYLVAKDNLVKEVKQLNRQVSA